MLLRPLPYGLSFSQLYIFALFFLVIETSLDIKFSNFFQAIIQTSLDNHSLNI